MQLRPADLETDATALLSQYNLTTTSQACMDIACPDPSTFLWYDGFNPTTTIHRLVARRLAGSIMST